MRQELTGLGQMFFLNLLLRRPTVVSFFTVEVISTWFIFLWRLKWSSFNEVVFLDCSLLRNIRKYNEFWFNLTYTWLHLATKHPINSLGLSFSVRAYSLIYQNCVLGVCLFVVFGLIEFTLVSIIVSMHLNKTTPNENKSKLTLTRKG